jgi:inner membrane protease ATP23
MSRDPIGEEDGINLYFLVMNRPVSNLDKIGLSVSEVECEKMVKEAKEYYISRVLLGLIKSDERCTVPTIKCGCCDQGGYFDPSIKVVVICANNLTSPGHAVGVLYHELTHAYDDCKGTRWNDCEQRACSEIRAIKISGECKPGGNKNQGRMMGGVLNFEKESDCVKKSAAASLEFVGCFPASGYINPVYERCANDLSPFDKDSL